VEVKRQQRDLGQVVPFLQDLTEQQARLFFAVGAFLKEYRPGDFQSLLDDDVVEAAEALATTFETSARGVIYDRRPASLPAERLSISLKAMLQEGGSGSSFERDVAVTLRRLAEATRAARAADAANPRHFLELLGRVIRRSDQGAQAGEKTASEPRIIIA
jgi:hypothetical protein